MHVPKRATCSVRPVGGLLRISYDVITTDVLFYICAPVSSSLNHCALLNTTTFTPLTCIATAISTLA